MEPIKPQILSQDKGPVVGFTLVAHESIIASEPAIVSDLQSTLEVPIQFYRGDLNLIRAEIHRIIDNAIDTLAGDS